MTKNKAQGYKTVFRTDDGREFFTAGEAAEHAKTMRVKLYIQGELTRCEAVTASVRENVAVDVEQLAGWLADKFNIEVPGDETEEDEIDEDESGEDENGLYASERDEDESEDETEDADDADDEDDEPDDEDANNKYWVIVESQDDTKAAEYARSLEVVAPKIMELIQQEFGPGEYFDYDDMARIGVEAGAGRKQVNENAFATRLARGLAHMGLIVRSKNARGKNFLHYTATPRKR